MKKTVTVPFMLLGVLFCVCLITSNLLETKIVQIGSLTLTAGLIVFPVSYIINDCIVEVWGYKKARLMIWVGFAMNFLVVGFAQLAVLLPAAPYWRGEEGFNDVFGMSLRIVGASFSAFLTGSFLNAYIMSKMKMASGGKYFSLRAVVSTVVGESADSLVFFPLAFAGVIPAREIIALILIQTALKSLYEIIVLPLTVVVVRCIKKVEQTDVYDEGVSYHVLKINDL